jgi:hypothetical protein
MASPFAIRFRAALLTAFLAPLLLGAAPARAEVFSFYCLTDNGNNCVGLLQADAQVEVRTAQVSETTMSFWFTNRALGDPSSITQIFFDSPLLVGPARVQDRSTGVDYGTATGDRNLPGGKPFGFKAAFGIEPNSAGGSSRNGVDPGEYLVLQISYADPTPGANERVIAGLNDGTTRVGLHVQGIGQAGGSDALVTSIEAIPEPTAWLLLATGLGVLGALGYRRRILG